MMTGSHVNSIYF